jgi:hypothetical protein
MRNLDNAAEPFLKPLVLGSFSAMNKQSRRMVAQWATLKMFVLEQDRALGEKFAFAVHSQSDRSNFMNYSQIPPGIVISIAYGREPEWADRVMRAVGGRDSPSWPPTENFDPAIFAHKIQQITWGIRKLRLVIASTNDMAHYRTRNWALPNMVPLWPPDTPDFIWPPAGPPVSDDEMEWIANLLMLGRSMTGGRSP